jgi:hypothetical protein
LKTLQKNITRTLEKKWYVNQFPGLCLAEKQWINQPIHFPDMNMKNLKCDENPPL